MRFNPKLALALVYFIGFVCSGRAQGLSFTTNTYTVGSAPYYVVAADINGDGKPDLISANNGSGSLTILTNNDSGLFGSNATLTVGSGPECVAVADINGDGKPDLISANGNEDTLTIYTNNGGGIFSFNATLHVGAPVLKAYFVAVSDVNGDGRPDLISADAIPPSSGSTLTVFTNNANNLPATNALLTVLTTPVCVIAVDVNGDGKPDLVCSSASVPSSHAIQVLTNNGIGVFGSNAMINVGIKPWTVIAADVNGDGKPDLITANSGDTTLTVLTNNGVGIFGFNATIQVGSSAWTVAAGDINGDGKIDLVSGNTDGNTLTVFTNNGIGKFGYNTTLNVGNSPRGVAVADLNADGHMDIISANGGTHTLTVLTQISPTSPLLNIVSNGTNQLLLSWTSSYNFAVLTNGDLMTTNWVVAGYNISIVGSTNQSTIVTSPAPDHLFFRLRGN